MHPTGRALLIRKNSRHLSHDLLWTLRGYLLRCIGSREETLHRMEIVPQLTICVDPWNSLEFTPTALIKSQIEIKKIMVY